jgi:hypothetical protein
MYILSTTPGFYLVIPPNVFPIVIVIMCHLVPTPESFEIPICSVIFTISYNLMYEPTLIKYKQIEETIS